MGVTADGSGAPTWAARRGLVVLLGALSYLGLGVQPPQASWGNLLTAARELSVLEAYPWQWMPAGALIVLTVLATNFVGDGLRDALDPKVKA